MDPIIADFTTGVNGPFWAEFEKQVQASFTFTDPLGQAISPPSSITLQGPVAAQCPDGGISPCTLSTYSDRWLAAAVWTVTDAIWQSMPGTVSGVVTIDLRTGPVSAQIPLKAYSATVKVVDRANNPIAGADLSVTLSNTTVVSFTTDSQGQAQLGHIPIGSYRVRVVYQSQEMGSWFPDAEQDPVYTIQLNVGGTVSGPIISAVVLLTILGVAMFLLLLAIKVRKPPLPPTI